MSGLNPEEIAAAQRQLSQYGQRATEVVGELIQACQANDHHRGGELCQEMYQQPDLLLLVVGLLTSTIVKNVTGPLASAEEMGMPVEDNPDAWQVGMVDQMEAAVEHRDINTFAALAVDGELRAMREDVRDALGRGEEMPSVEHLMRAFMVMDRVTVTAIAAEQMRRLLKLEVERGGG